MTAPIVEGEDAEIAIEAICAALLATAVQSCGDYHDDARVLLRRIAARCELLAEHDGPYPSEF